VGKLLNKLPDKHKRFVLEYITSMNKAAAYRKVYNCTEAHSYDAAYRLAGKPEIKAAIQEALEEEYEKAEQTRQRIQTLITFDLTRFLNEDSTVNLSALKDSGYGWLIKGVRSTKYGDDVYLMDKDKALEQMAKMHQLYSTVTTEINMNDALAVEDCLLEKMNDIRSKLAGTDSTKTESESIT
jgi:hypothetical protein